MIASRLMCNATVKEFVSSSFFCYLRTLLAKMKFFVKPNFDKIQEARANTRPKRVFPWWLKTGFFFQSILFFLLFNSQSPSVLSEFDYYWSVVMAGVFAFLFALTFDQVVIRMKSDHREDLAI